MKHAPEKHTNLKNLHKIIFAFFEWNMLQIQAPKKDSRGSEKF